jgi:hypothetical protein
MLITTYYVVTHDFEAEGPGELSLREGDLVRVPVPQDGDSEAASLGGASQAVEDAQEDVEEMSRASDDGWILVEVRRP